MIEMWNYLGHLQHNSAGVYIMHIATLTAQAEAL